MSAHNRADAIKRRLRALKKLESRLRFGQAANTRTGNLPRLVWDSFFALGDRGGGLYHIDLLVVMDDEALRIVLDEYICAVYERIFGGGARELHDSGGAHELLGLHTDAGREEIRERYRQLAKTKHPDVGGSDAEFIALKAAVDSLLEHR